MKHLLALFALPAFLCGQSPASEEPNILILVSDDQGYADAGFQGSKQAVTPHLDSIGGGHRSTGWQPDERQYTLPLNCGGENISGTAANEGGATRLTAAHNGCRKALIAPVFQGASVKNEDSGAGGANQKNAAPKKPAIL